MKKIISILALSILLVSCWADENPETMESKNTTTISETNTWASANEEKTNTEEVTDTKEVENEETPDDNKVDNTQINEETSEIINSEKVTINDWKNREVSISEDIQLSEEDEKVLPEWENTNTEDEILEDIDWLINEIIKAENE